MTNVFLCANMSALDYSWQVLDVVPADSYLRVYMLAIRTPPSRSFQINSSA